jgi:hypothetical protein
MNTYPFAGEIKMEKVIKDGKEVIECEQVEYTFTPPGKEWARIDKDMNVVHLDMELCAKGPHNAYTALAMAIWNKAIETEREACAELAMQGTNEPVQTKTLEILRKERERIAEAIRARGDK